MNFATPFVVVLGTAQDGGCPQMGCRCHACQAAREDVSLKRLPACLGIVDRETAAYWLIDATPYFAEQLETLRDTIGESCRSVPDGILLTHAHMGHYPGLLQLGPEVMAAAGVPVWVMPRMREFLVGNSPWRELIKQGHVELRDLEANAAVALNDRVQIMPLAIPHRGELSETVAFRVSLVNDSVLWLPDIDDWDEGIEERIEDCQAAWIDGTFFDHTELPERDMTKILHPTIADSLERFAELPPEERAKIRFVHLNHSNPVTTPESAAALRVREAGMHVSVEGECWPARPVP